MTKRIAFAALALLGIGCQTYEPRPLDVVDYSRLWRVQVLDVEPVRAYADMLASFTPEAVPFDPADGITLHEAEALALHFNPGLRAERARANVPLVTAEEAGWWPDPQLQAQVLRFTDRGSESPLGIVNDDYIDEPWVVNAGLNVTIPVSGRLAVEQDLRWSEYDAAWREILVSEWQLLTRLRAAWFEWSTAEQRLLIERSFIEQIDIVAGTADQIASAGEMQPTEARVLRIELAAELTRLLEFESSALQKRIAVLALMGLVPDAPVTLEPLTFVTDVPIGPDERRARLIEVHPRIKVAEAEYAAAEQHLRLEVRMQYPDVQLGPAFNWEEDFWRVGLGMALPIPVWNRNRQGVAQAMEGREAARRTAELAVQDAVSTMAMVETNLEYAARQREYLTQQVAPLVDQQVDESRALLNLGEANVLVLRDALASSLAAKLRLLDVTLDEALAANRLGQMLQPRWVTGVVRRDEGQP